MPPIPEQPDFEPQDQAEVFDEDNTVGAGDDIPPAEMRTFEEMAQVRDETAAIGDSDDDEAQFAEDLTDDEIVALGRDEQDGLARDGDRPVFDAAQDGGGPGRAESEAPLIDAGDMQAAPDTPRADPAGLEAERLSDADLQDLGYQDKSSKG
ncbi:MAG: hypothetical protein Q7V15_11125 [Phenylobacterium sp.]|uniref:hypothetical protein n=1 Tax=Phenylobacterium sp. TaxID=1871053 RepID=UPI002726B3D2|nr:hypothetical protein [Phenylobacterium sp.]MDO8901897.1 hypothetical protein [Phenylobacterium sp.]MDP2212409.1 hypothetical protein [Phenylobacterium sp.]